MSKKTAHKKTHVSVYNKNWEYIRMFCSVREAERITGIKDITRLLKGKNHSKFNFVVTDFEVIKYPSKMNFKDEKSRQTR